MPLSYRRILAAKAAALLWQALAALSGGLLAAGQVYGCLLYTSRCV